MAAVEGNDAAAVEEAGRAIELRIRIEAKRIASKYIEPPTTTDIAVMFLPTEGLYAEVIRRPGLVSELLAQHRVTVTGPTTLAAILTTIQWGGRAFTIQQRSADIARLLEKAKNEFGKFTAVIDKVQKQIDLAAKTLDTEVGVRSRAIERTLREVEAEALPAPAEAPPAEALPRAAEGGAIGATASAGRCTKGRAPALRDSPWDKSFGTSFAIPVNGLGHLSQANHRPPPRVPARRPAPVWRRPSPGGARSTGRRRAPRRCRGSCGRRAPAPRRARPRPPDARRRPSAWRRRS
jgi:hypothetical protein